MDIICIGAVLWDVIGRTSVSMRAGHDVAGRITRLPGGVALNVAMALRRAGVRPVLLSAVGRDAAGDELLLACAALGLDISHVYRSDLPTDQYMAIEAENGLIAAVADAHSLEAAAGHILMPFLDGRMGAEFEGAIVLDGNLTESLLRQIVADPAFAGTDLRVAPASPGKVRRLEPVLHHVGLTLYINRIEAELLLGTRLGSAEEAARALRTHGVARVLVTDGGHPCALAFGTQLLNGHPPPVTVVRVTGAGDTFMAAHIAAERRGSDPQTALDAALDVTALYVSGETTL